MEAATKKRGRPRSAARETLEDCAALCAGNTNSLRAQINDVYACSSLYHLTGPEYEFFHNEKGKFIRHGIAEQIGRLYDVQFISAEEIPEVVRICMGYYEQGYSVKAIERYLRSFRFQRAGG